MRKTSNIERELEVRFALEIGKFATTIDDVESLIG